MTDLGFYRCEGCDGVFQKGWSDADAEAELENRWPGTSKADCAIVCEVCYRQALRRLEN